MSERWVPMVPASTMPVWSFVLLMVFLIALMGVFGWFLYWSKHTRFQIQNSEIHFDAGLYSKSISLQDIDVSSMGLLDYEQAPALKPRVRINGIGLPGYKSGWYRLANEEKALLYVTDESKMLAFKTLEGYWVFMSVMDPTSFVEQLQEAITKG